MVWGILCYFFWFKYAAEYFRDWRDCSVILINLTNCYKLLHLFNTKFWSNILYFEKAEEKWNEIEVFIQLFVIAQLFIDILWWGSIKLQILKLKFRFNAKISNFFFFSWYFVVRINIILSFIARFIWPEKGNNRAWIAFSIKLNIEQESLKISFSIFSIYQFTITEFIEKSVAHFICFLFCPFLFLTS